MSKYDKNTPNAKGYTIAHLITLKSILDQSLISFAKQIIYDADVELAIKGPLGWTPLQEAAFYVHPSNIERNIFLTTHIFKSIYMKKRDQIAECFLKIGAHLQQIQDFYL